MRKSYRHACLAVVAMASMTAAAHAATLTSWDFNNAALSSDGAGDVQAETITASGLSNYTPDGTAGVAFKTTGASADGGSPNDYVRAGIGGDATSAGGTYSAALSNEGGYFQWSDPTTGYTGTTVSWYANASSLTSGAFLAETLYYSTNGGGAWTLAAAETLSSSFTQYSVNVSTLSGGTIDDNALAEFRIVFTGSSTTYAGTGGPNARVDLLAVTATPSSPVPEPASLTLLALGAVGLLARRRR